MLFGLVVGGVRVGSVVCGSVVRGFGPVVAWERAGSVVWDGAGPVRR